MTRAHLTRSRATRWGLVLAGSLATVAVAQPAMAVTWNSSSSPLKVTEDGKTQGAAYGNFYNSGGSYAKSQSTRKDYKAGGNGIYVDTKWYYYEQDCSTDGCSTTYQPSGHSETSRTTSGSWVSQTVSDSLSRTATAARGAIHVCEDQSFSGDPCSATVIRTFSY